MSKKHVQPFISEPIFENIKNINQQGKEYWSARQLAKALDYPNYRQFVYVLKKARQACLNSNNSVTDHFQQAEETISYPSGKQRKVTTLNLSRYACYLVVQNANPEKRIVALGQTYFAIQNRKQELYEQDTLPPEEQSRLLLRNEMIRYNKELARAARRAGVIESDDFSAFQNLGYQGLYGGLDQKQVHEKKGLKKNQKILDYMCSTELAANLFRATQTQAKLANENIKAKEIAYKIHYNVGQKIRQTIEELGGTMPEALPTPRTNAKTILRRQIKTIAKKA